MSEFAFVLNIPVRIRLIAWCLASWYPRAMDLDLEVHPYRDEGTLAGACLLHGAIAAKPFPRQ